MNLGKLSAISRLSLTTAALVLVVFGCAAASAQTEAVLYSFQNTPDGAQPVAGLLADKTGNLYGTTTGGGAGYGTVYQLSPPTSPSGSWTETVLYEFQGGSDGAYPYSTLISDQDGNLYGTTLEGGIQGACDFCGTVFKLTKRHGSWKESLLHSFNGYDGANPYGALVFDEDGNLYGTTSYGGSSSAGTVYKLTARDNEAGGPWSEKVLYNFTGGPDGGLPLSDLLLGRDGRLYGTATQGGLGYGVVFQLTPPDRRGSKWSELAIYTFTGGSDGAGPFDGVLFDQRGNLVGVAPSGGNQSCAGGCGTVYQLTPPARARGAWSEHTLYAFTGGADGAQPFAKPVLSNRGTLYGTASIGGPSDLLCSPYCGTVYALTPPVSWGNSWTETTLYGFGANSDGYGPESSLLLGKHDTLYGTTTGGGTSSGGAVYQLLP